MDRKAEEEPMAELLATTATRRGARPADAQQARDLRDAPLEGPAPLRGPRAGRLGPRGWPLRHLLEASQPGVQRQLSMDCAGGNYRRGVGPVRL